MPIETTDEEIDALLASRPQPQPTVQRGEVLRHAPPPGVLTPPPSREPAPAALPAISEEEDAEITRAIDGIRAARGEQSPNLEAPPDLAERGFFGDMGAAFKRGWHRGMQGANVLTAGNLESHAEAGADIAERERAARSHVQDPETAAVLQKTQDQGFWDATKTFLKNPKALAELAVESLGVQLPSLGLGTAGRVAGTAAGALTGAAGGGPIGGFAGAAVGMGAGSYVTEYTQTILGELRNSQIDLADPTAVTSALQDASLMKRARERGAQRGLPIAVFDAFSGGIAGKLFKPVSEAAQKVVGKTAGKVAGVTAELGTQMATGGAGELGAQLAEGGPIRGGEIAAEMLAELPFGGLEAITGTAVDRVMARNAGIDAPPGPAEAAISTTASPGEGPGAVKPPPGSTRRTDEDVSASVLYGAEPPGPDVSQANIDPAVQRNDAVQTVPLQNTPTPGAPGTQAAQAVTPPVDEFDDATAKLVHSGRRTRDQAARERFEADKPSVDRDRALAYLAKSQNSKGSFGINRAELEAEGFDPADLKGSRARFGLRYAATKNGMSIEEAGERLRDGGFDVLGPDGGLDRNKVLGIIDDELRGTDRFSTHRSAELIDEQMNAELDAELEARQAYEAEVPEAERPTIDELEEFGEPITADAERWQQLSAVADRYGADPEEVDRILELPDDAAATERLLELIERGGGNAYTTKYRQRLESQAAGQAPESLPAQEAGSEGPVAEGDLHPELTRESTGEPDWLTDDGEQPLQQTERSAEAEGLVEAESQPANEPPEPEPGAAREPVAGDLELTSPDAGADAPAEPQRPVERDLFGADAAQADALTAQNSRIARKLGDGRKPVAPEVGGGLFAAARAKEDAAASAAQTDLTAITEGVKERRGMSPGDRVRGIGQTEGFGEGTIQSFERVGGRLAAHVVFDDDERKQPLIFEPKDLERIGTAAPEATKPELAAASSTASEPADRTAPEVRTALDEAAHEAATSPLNGKAAPTQAQKEAGNYAKGHVRVQSLDVAIENPKGSTREGQDKGGKKWSVQMPAHYGYIKRTEGADGDHVDAYLGPHAEDPTKRVYVIDQGRPNVRQFDEHKVMLGFASREEAIDTYARGFTDNFRSKMKANIVGVTELSIDEFKEWVKNGDTTKPLSKTKRPASATKAPSSETAAPADESVDEDSTPLSEEEIDKSIEQLLGLTQGGRERAVETLKRNPNDTEAALQIARHSWGTFGGSSVGRTFVEGRNQKITVSAGADSISLSPKQWVQRVRRILANEIEQQPQSAGGFKVGDQVRTTGTKVGTIKRIFQAPGKGGEKARLRAEVHWPDKPAMGAETGGSDQNVDLADLKRVEQSATVAPSQVATKAETDNAIEQQVLEQEPSKLPAGQQGRSEESSAAQDGRAAEPPAGALRDVAPDAGAASTVAPAAKPKASPQASANKIFTEDAAKAARERLLAKRSKLTAGLDPQDFLDGVTLAGYHVERGARTFAAYARAMVQDLGDWVRPYLKQWYIAVKLDPAVTDELRKDMSDEVETLKADVDQLLEQQPEQEAQATEREAEVARPDAEQGVLFAESGNPQPARSSARPAPPAPPKPVREPAAVVKSLREKVAAQKEADKIPLSSGLENIKATLPFLTDGQQHDVEFAENRFAKPDGYGVLFTNGTGTGKTYTSLGIVKRYARAGKENIFIGVQSQILADDYVAAARNLGLQVHQLENTRTPGKGIVITTYANMGMNRTLADRQWDLIVADESQNLGSNADGTLTGAAEALRAMALHPSGFYTRAQMIHRPLYDEMQQLRAKIDKPGATPSEELRKMEARFSEVHREWQAKVTEVQKDMKANQGAKRPRVVFLSATPFAYDKAIEYAEGFLFEYPADDGAMGYNVARGRDAFFVQHFGYRMRNGKLTQPDANVDSALMERAFNRMLKANKVLSGRMLEVDADYQRKFILTESKIGVKIDEGLEFLRNAHEGKYRPLYEHLIKRFDHLNRSFLLEAIKAKEFLPIIRAEMAAGRKVVVFHDFNKGGGFHPFTFDTMSEVDVFPANGGVMKFGVLARQFMDERADLVNLDFEGLLPPIQRMAKEFPDALFFNGQVTPKERIENKEKFNSDDPRYNLIVVQSQAGGAGLSLHDTRGKYRRTLINLGMPTRPIATIQIEGRIYRTGVVSDALYLYGNTGTNWERGTFAEKIAERASTAENLAMGEEARALKRGFIDAFEDPDEAHEPRETDGKGGKEKDRAGAMTLTRFQQAISHYYAQQKKTSRNKSAEGIDYYPTPEPLALKMVEWAQARPGESMLEPSAGHGAIARWMPEDTRNTIIEPRVDLLTKAQLATQGEAKPVNDRFENFNIINKFDGIVMNPPFGHGGKTAMDHLEKAAHHLRDGGRLVALIPRGPMADKRFEQLLYGKEGDPKSKGLKDVYLVGEYLLPSVTFERAGTTVSTRIVVLDKHSDPTKVMPQSARDWKDIESIKEFFDRIEHAEVPTRPDPPPRQASAPAPAPAAAAAKPSVASGVLEAAQTKHTKTGKDLFVARIPNKVSDEVYRALKSAAKEFGGYYSSFRGAGAIPGFQFDTADARDRFMASVATPRVAEAQPSFKLRRDDTQATRDTRAELMEEATLAATVSGSQGYETFALAFNAELIKKGAAPLVGQRIRTPEDLAYAAQVYRDPRFETMRYFFADENGKIVFQTGVSSRLPSASALYPEGLDDLWLHALARQSKAKKLWMLHNHPSGDSNPSPSDELVTAQLRASFEGMGIEVEHVVIDSNEYSVIDKSGQIEPHIPLDMGPDKLLQASKPHPMLGKPMNRAADIAAVGKAIQVTPGWQTLIGLDAGGFIRAMAELSPQVLSNTEELRKVLKEFSINSGAAGTFLYGVEPTVLSDGKTIFNQDRVKRWAAKLIEENFVADIIDSNGRSVREAPNVGESHRNTFFGEKFDQLARVVREEGPQYNSPPLEAQRQTLKALREGQPLDRLMRLPFRMLGLLNERDEFRPGVWAYDKLSQYLTSKKFDPESPFAFFNPILEHARHGLIDRYNVPREFIRRTDQRLSEAREIVAQGHDFLRALVAKGVTSHDEAVLLQKLLNGQQVGPKEWEGVAQEIRDTIDAYGAELVSLGVISNESRERFRGGYLHRAYLKHEAAGAGNSLSNFINKMVTGRRVKFAADQMKGRGIFQKVTQSRLLRELSSKDINDFFGIKKIQGQADPSLIGKRFRMLDLTQQDGEGTEPLSKEVLGEGAAPEKLKHRVYWPADTEIPARYGNYTDRGAFEVRRVEGGEYVLWRDYTEAERQQMGEILDARYTIAKTFHLFAQNLSTGRFFKDVAQNPEWTYHGQGAPPKDTIADKTQALRHYVGFEWVLVPDDKLAGTGGKLKWGALAGKYVRAEIWKDLNELDRMNRGGLWDTFLRQWKLNKTARNPVVHMNNVISNIALSDLVDVRWRDILRGFQSYTKQDDMYQLAQRHAAFGHGYVDIELREKLLEPILKELQRDAEKGLFEEGFIGKLRFMDKFSRIVSEVGKRVGQFDDVMTRAYQLEDEIFRMAAFMRRLELGDTPQQAAAVAREEFMNYDIRAPWVNAARRSVLPFLAYTYRAVPLIVDAITKRPWKLAKYIALAELANAMAYALSDGDEEKERALMREQEKGSTWLGAPRMMRMPWNDAHNNPVFLDIRRWIPAGDVFDTQSNAPLPLPAWMQMGGPLMIGAEMVLNRSAFTQQDIINPLVDDTGDRLAKYGTHLYRSYFPSAPWVPESWYWEKIESAIEGRRDVLGRPYSIAQALSSSVGVKLMPQDPDMNLRFRQQEFERQERALKSTRTMLARDLNRKIIDQDTYAEEVADINQKLQALAERRIEIFRHGSSTAAPAQSASSAELKRAASQ